MTADKTEIIEAPTEVMPTESLPAEAISHEPIQGLAPMVQAVMRGQVTPDTLKEMLDIQKDYEANEAKKRFNAALSSLLSALPTIKRDMDVSYSTSKGKTSYSHSSLGYTLDIVRKHLADNNFSINWRTAQADGMVKVTCILSHSAGHSERTELSSMPDDSGGKNSIQAIGSAVKYLERYTLFAMLGLASGDDDDGKAAGGAETLSEEQQATVQDLLNSTGADKVKFLRWAKVSKISEINAGAYKSVIAMIKRKK